MAASHASRVVGDTHYGVLQIQARDAEIAKQNSKIHDLLRQQSLISAAASRPRSASQVSTTEATGQGGAEAARASEEQAAAAAADQEELAMLREENDELVATVGCRCASLQLGCADNCELQVEALEAQLNEAVLGGAESRGGDTPTSAAKVEEDEADEDEEGDDDEEDGAAGNASDTVTTPSSRTKRRKRSSRKKGKRRRRKLGARPTHLAGHERFPFELLGRETHERGYVSKVVPVGVTTEFSQHCAFSKLVGWKGPAPKLKQARKRGSTGGVPSSPAHELDTSQPLLVALRRTLADIMQAKRVADQVSKPHPKYLSHHVDIHGLWNAGSRLRTCREGGVAMLRISVARASI